MAFGALIPELTVKLPLQARARSTSLQLSFSSCIPIINHIRRICNGKALANSNKFCAAFLRKMLKENVAGQGFFGKEILFFAKNSYIF